MNDSKINPNAYHRRSIRLKGSDYSKPGAYFITICTHDKLYLFGEVFDSGGTEPAVMKLNEAGRIIYEEWLNTEKIRNEIRLDEFVIMPNHIHGIVWITGANTTTPNPLRAYGMRPKNAICPTNGNASAPNDVSTHNVGANGIRPLNGMGVLPYARTMPYARAKQNGVSVKPGFVSPSKTIGAMVRGFKSAATRRIRDTRQMPEMMVWQRNYWEHIIRNDADMTRIREYIHNNPAQWELDSLNINAPCGEKLHGE